MQALFGVAEDKKEPTPPTPAAKAPEKTPEPVKPEPEKTPIGVRKKPVKRPEIPVLSPKPTVTTAQTPITAAKPDIEIPEDQLVPEEKEFLKDLADLESLDPAKYKGLSARGKRYVAERIKFLEAHPDIEEGDAEYQAWTKKNKPSVSSKEFTALEVHRQTSRVKQEYDGRLNDLQHENYVREETPKIKKEADDLYVKMARQAVPDEILADLDKAQRETNPAEGWKKTREQYAFELDIAERIMTEATADLEEFMRITRVNQTTGKSVKSVDMNNPLHVRLLEMIGEVCDQFKKGADQKQQIRDGKWFVTRDEWNSMAPEARSQFWTFKNNEIVDQSMRSIKMAIKGAIDQKRQEMTRYGFQRPVRAAGQAAPATQTPPTPPTPGSPPPAPRPGPIPNNTPPSTGVDPRIASLAKHLTGG